MSPDGTDERRINQSPGGDEKHASWAPDSKKVIYANDEYDSGGKFRYWDIEVVNGYGSPVAKYAPDSEKLTDNWDNDFSDSRPLYSPDGSRFLFQRGALTSGAGGLYVANADGSNIQQASEKAGNPQWSPGGTKIMVQGSPSPGGSCGTGVYPSDIYLISADDYSITNVTGALRNAGGAGTCLSFYRATWSPDGSKIAFLGYDAASEPSDRDLYVANADGSGINKIFEKGTDDLASFNSVEAPTWAPNSTEIAMLLDNHSEHGEIVEREIGKIKSDGTGLTRLTSSAADERPGGGPQWSPDGNKIAFYSYSASAIYTINSDGTGKTKAANNATSNNWTYARLDPDVEKPTVSGMRPKPGSRVKGTKPRIKATVRDTYPTYFIEKNITLKVNRKKVTKFSYNRDTDRLVFRRKFPKGEKVKVQIIARDPAGNVVKKSWRFTIKK